MSSSRSDSHSHSQYGRRRSNTAQSVLRPIPDSPPLNVGDSKPLTLWIHDPKDSATTILNELWWPGVAVGDLLSVAASGQAFLFTVSRNETVPKPQLQISVSRPIADAFGMKNLGEVTVTKVDRNKYQAEYVEFIFQDLYLGRNDMWRLGEKLVDECVYVGQEVNLIGGASAKIQNIYIGGNKVSAAYMTQHTKAIYCSLSAKVTIFIQVCHELWEFAGDGERYNEKIVHSFLPALFSKWREAGTNHTVTIVLISRVYYDEGDLEYAAGPLRQDERGEWYKDFYKVITDLEVVQEWKPTLVSLKNTFWDFQRDILLTHHYHRSSGTEQARLVGRLSYAHDGPILEAMNIALSPTETHYIDRSLTLTGSSTIMTTPGTGYFRVSKSLLRLTSTRLLDQGFGLNLISLAKPPLHSSPIFSFQTGEPPKMADGSVLNSKNIDPLWTDDDPNSIKSTCWWEPFWISISFWDKQMDMPFREDRFITRAKMHQIQMMGLLEHDVIASIEVPFLDESLDNHDKQKGLITQEEADTFDRDIFAFSTEPEPPKAIEVGRISRSNSFRTERRESYRGQIKIHPIRESPRSEVKELPTEDTVEKLAPTRAPLSSSPSQSSIKSSRSNQSSTSSKVASSRTRDPSVSRTSTLSSKLTPSWLFKPFRSGPSEPQTSAVSISANPSVESPPTATIPLSSASTSSPNRAQQALRRSVSSKKSPHPPSPMAIKSPASNLSRALEDDGFRSSGIQRSPANTINGLGIVVGDPQSSPKRRGTLASIAGTGFAPSSSSPVFRTNPSQPRSHVSRVQSSLASRWQHMFPKEVYKHEIKWRELVTPPCLPLTVESFPSTLELDSAYDVSSYEFLVDTKEMKSFLVRSPSLNAHQNGSSDEIRRAWALVVMRGMAAVRLAQGFQFVVRPEGKEVEALQPPLPRQQGFRRSKTFPASEDMVPTPTGASEVLRSTTHPVYLSMTNEIHRIEYTGEAIEVKRFVRRMTPHKPFQYQSLIWPKLGLGYTEQKIKFVSHGLENYGWNRLDMLVAGYEHQFNESLRYWRTRFVVIPTAEPPSLSPSEEKLNEEEARILGMEKLAEHFNKVRWKSSGTEDEKTTSPPLRFLITTLNPAYCVLDNTLMEQLDQIHATGPLRKNVKSEREVAEMPLLALAKAMREEGGVPIKHNQWHSTRYPDSFTGFEFVSWLVREFRDVSTRAQGAEWGVKLQEQGLIEHCRGYHNFLDGHYFYRLRGEYASVSTPRGWFRSRHLPEDLTMTPRTPLSKKSDSVPRRKQRRILSQSMVIDIDSGHRSDQAETVVLHHDIIHNPSTVFHFELQWVGTTARIIDEQVRQWNKAIERYGLRLVEAYVTQISDVRDSNAFQSCFPIPLALPPPIIPNLRERCPEGTQTHMYFEYALLRRFGFILDIEAAELYPDYIDVVYSYRRAPYKHSQFVHRSGVAFVQVLGGEKGFLFLTNRLLAPGRLNLKRRPAAAAEDIRVNFHEFCSDRDALRKVYDEEIDHLLPIAEEPEPLSI